MCVFPPRMLIPETLRPEGVPGSQFETQDEEGTKEGFCYPQEDVSGARKVTVFVCDRGRYRT